MLSPFVCGAVLLVFVVTVAATRYVSLASILAALSFPIGLWIEGRLSPGSAAGDGWLLLNSALIAALITFKHRENMARLLRGNENKLGGSASGVDRR